GGTYTSAQTVTISDATPGATIHYTTDGSTPSGTAGTLYAGPVTISTTATLRAVASAAGLADSPVTSDLYTINTGPTAPSAPVFSPAPGTYTSAQSVLISSNGATSIYYTTDGSTPTTASSLFTGPVSIASTTTLKAIGVNSAGTSPVTTGVYTISTGGGPL